MSKAPEKATRVRVPTTHETNTTAMRHRLSDVYDVLKEDYRNTILVKCKDEDVFIIMSVRGYEELLGK